MKQYQIDRIKDLMDAKGITNQELAAMCNISAMTVGRLLTKTDYNPTTDTVEKIAEALGVHEQYIYEAEGESKAKMPINGYIEYGGTISSIRTFKQLEKVYEGIRYDMNVPKLAKELRARDKQNKKTQAKTEIDINAIALRRPEEYDTSKVKTWSFLHTDDVRDGVSINIGNFSTDHELDLCGEHFYHSESAYIVGLFSQNTEESTRIQREVQYEKSPMDAKYTVRARYTKQGKSRKDWDDFKHQWMLYVVWQKCLTNAEFAELLRLTPKDVFIIENTTNQTNGRKEDDSSDYWGAKNKELEDGHDLIEREVELSNPTMSARELKKLKSIERNKINNVGIWKGINCLGKCLNICKYCLDNGITPPIDYDLLRSKQIYLFGKLLTFEDEPTVPPTPKTPKKKAAEVAKATEKPEGTKRKYRSVIFDFDGTLLDTRPMFKYRDLLKGKSRYHNQEAFQEAYKEFVEHLKDCKTYEGMDEVLKFIKDNNITAYIVTGGGRTRPFDAMKLFGWKGVFKDVIGRFSVNKNKKVTKADNNPILFKKALDTFGEDARNCISFGNEVVDCHAARKAGIESYCVYWGAEGKDKEIMDGEMKDFTIHSPLEIIDILKSEPKEVELTDEEKFELASEPIIPNMGIIGALCGDFLGSVYERKPNKDIPLDKRLEHKFGMKYTDDTVQTLAVAQWLMTDPEHKPETLIKQMKMYGKKFRKKSHGEYFIQWLESKDNKPNNLEEDGSAMRVSPISYYAKNLRECLNLAKITAEVSHNSKEGIYGAQASAAAVFLYLHGKTKEEIKNYITKKFAYDLNRSTDDIRPTYKLETLCSKVVPEAIICFLEGETYEDVIKLAISLGGDADTQGAIAGGIAAAKMPIPQILADLCYENLPAELQQTLLSFNDFLSKRTLPESAKVSEPVTEESPILDAVEAQEGDIFLKPDLEVNGYYIYSCFNFDQAKEVRNTRWCYCNSDEKYVFYTQNSGFLFVCARKGYKMVKNPHEGNDKDLRFKLYDDFAVSLFSLTTFINPKTNEADMYSVTFRRNDTSHHYEGANKDTYDEMMQKASELLGGFDIAKYCIDKTKERASSPSIMSFSQVDGKTKKKLKKLGIKRLEGLYSKRNTILSTEIERTRECERHWMEAKPITWDDFSFRQTHEYDTQKQECWSFNSGKDVRNGISLQLGNMVNGFGVNVLGIDFLNSEVPYQLAIFKNDEASINIQKEIINPKNPVFSNGLAMKRVYVYGKEYEKYRRDKDFELGDKFWCYEWMKWIVWEKVKQNQGFRDILLAIPRNAVIIEKAQKESHTMWGAWNDELLKEREIVKLAAELESGKGKTSKSVMDMLYKVNNVGIWKGENAMGQILTMAKLALNEGIQMPIDVKMLNDARINWFGEVLHFTKDAEGNVTVEAI